MRRSLRREVLTQNCNCSVEADSGETALERARKAIRALSQYGRGASCKVEARKYRASAKLLERHSFDPEPRPTMTECPIVKHVTTKGEPPNGVVLR